MNVQKSLTKKRAWVIGRVIPSSARITEAGWLHWPRGSRAMCWRGIYAASMPMGVTAVTTRLLTPHKDKCHTITFDNGKEFAEHESMAAELKADHLFRPSLSLLGAGIEREQ